MRSATPFATTCEQRPAKAPLIPPPPTGWLTRHPDSLTEAEQPQLKAILARCVGLQAASSFAKGLEQDLDAVIQAAVGTQDRPKDASTTSERSRGRCSGGLA
ncbi:hypothetical protein [Actinomadura rudentiformis]|uniref:Uncharacterized protein n=1 Tax=Actinomadura rudentiformis TaxID=359158 RepID=A0A6H9YS66_9ACTN|nr:hypothetical protein [Actinomadura rudentiformis]KAB2348293.1 hypothetical protein F8566_15885 [Actinomadura rudentiformis]